MANLLSNKQYMTITHSTGIWYLCDLIGDSNERRLQESNLY